MAKRKSSKKQSQGVIYLIVLACLALICREPIARALQDKLPVIKERITQKATPAITGSPPASRPPEKRARTDIAPQGLYHFVQPRT